MHLQRLNEAFGLRLPCSPSYTGLRLIIQGVDPAGLEAAFRRHASAISTPPASDELVAIAIDGKTLRGSFDAFSGGAFLASGSLARGSSMALIGS